MKKIRLIDGCFPGNHSSIAGDNVWRGPQHFEWDRGSGESLYTWFTNWTLRDVTHGHLRPRIAWLLEPPSINFWPYVVASEDRNKFDAIMTYDKHLLDAGDNRFKFAPHGGRWMDGYSECESLFYQTAGRARIRAAQSQGSFFCTRPQTLWAKNLCSTQVFKRFPQLSFPRSLSLTPIRERGPNQ